MSTQFVHLRLHTEFSIVDGLVRIKPLMKALVFKNMNAIAITDFCNLFAIIKFFTIAIAHGIKPIIGCDLPLDNNNFSGIIFPVLCQNNLGYKNLTRIVSQAYLENNGKVDINNLTSLLTEGLIALSGGRLGLIGQALLNHDYNTAKKWINFYKTLFPQRFYLEIQRTGHNHDTEYNEKIILLAKEFFLPLVATNSVCFLEAEDFIAHEARICINNGTLLKNKRYAQYTAEQYLRSADEMCELFKDLPHAITNTIIIAQRCNVKIELGANYLPSFPLPNNITMSEYLSNIATTGLNKRFLIYNINRDHKIYAQRLQLELDIINTMGYSGYFLIVADFIHWAKTNNIPVGPGRGSGAGSLVAYALNITDIDPLQYDLLFERFLNPERVSMPDFDIDFCIEGRDRVIEYVAKKYGKKNVSQIITFGTMAAKAVIRDVGRVLGHPYGFVDKLAKLIPFELGITLTKALQDNEELKFRYDNENEVKELFDLALKLEGITKNAGKHAGGLIIAPSELTDFTAIYSEPNSDQFVSQLDKDDVEAVGLVKFDFLGLRTLTIIDWALKIINQHKSPEEYIDIALINTNDSATFTLLKSCQTTAIFQLESHGMKELIKRLQPDCFEDIIALVALFRPGPLQSGMVDDFIERKHGKSKVIYLHPDLEPILKATYGVILYQEQVMQIARVLANYTLGSADLLRRAMGKKKPEEMAKQREIFLNGAKNREISENIARSIFDLMEKFAGYGFNKSHSAAYALVAYQTAWLKTHYPTAFMAAVISADIDNTDKVVHFITECKNMGIQVKSPEINSSYYDFHVYDNKTILYGLGAIKGIGKNTIECIIDERNNHGNYLNLFDFCKRINLRKVNRRVMEALIKCGALDNFAVERSIMLASLDNALKLAGQVQKNIEYGQITLLSLLDEDTSSTTDVSYNICPPWTNLQRLFREKETLGLFLTGHPVDYYLQEFNKILLPMNKLQVINNKTKTLTCGLIIDLKQITTKKGKKLVLVTIEDQYNKLDIVIFNEIFLKLPEPLKGGQIYIFSGIISKDNFTGNIKMVASNVYSIEYLRKNYSQALIISLSQQDNDIITELQNIIRNHSGSCPVQIEYTNNQIKTKLNLNQIWQVSINDELLYALQQLLGNNKIIIQYKTGIESTC